MPLKSANSKSASVAVEGPGEEPFEVGAVTVAGTDDVFAVCGWLCDIVRKETKRYIKSSQEITPELSQKVQQYCWTLRSKVLLALDSIS